MKREPTLDGMKKYVEKCAVAWARKEAYYSFSAADSCLEGKRKCSLSDIVLGNVQTVEKLVVPTIEDTCTDDEFTSFPSFIDHVKKKA